MLITQYIINVMVAQLSHFIFRRCQQFCVHTW